jgi:glycosyltransferase involved in cell wall biosynthesis
MHKPSISIVTPSYNQASFLEQAICSVLDQGYSNLEYIIIDGGSTDESIEIIKKYTKHLTYWVSEKDAGQSDGINKGLRRAKGEIVAWLNSDDYYLPNIFGNVAEAYLQFPNASFYFGDGYRVNKAGNIKSGFLTSKPLKFNREGFIYGLNYILQPASFMNRKHLASINYLNPSLKYGMDSDLWIRLSELAEPLFINQFLAASREYGDTKTSTGLFERIEELRKIAEQHSGCPMTPGVLFYFCGTLKEFCKDSPEMFSLSYINSIDKLWKHSGQLMTQFGVKADGFPPTGSTALGIHEDGWISETFTVLFEEKNEIAWLEITLEAPNWLPSEYIEIIAKQGFLNKKKFLLKRGESKKYYLKLNKKRGRICFSLAPSFAPIQLFPKSNDDRNLVCLCKSLQLTANNMVLELFSLS